MTKKKSRSFIPAIVILVLAVLAAAGVKTFLGPCVHEDGTFGPCHAAGQALFGLSLVAAAESALAVWSKDEGVRRGLYLSLMLTALITLAGTALIGAAASLAAARRLSKADPGIVLRGN